MPDNAEKGPNAKRKASELTESDFANEKMGNNQLQGDDQASVRNQRHAVAGVKQEAEGVIESLENLDPKVRADRAREDRATK